MTPTPRPSLTTDLATRYANQREGGAFDAKKAGTPTSPSSLQEAQFEKTDTFVKPIQGISNFKGTDTQNYKEISSLAQGIDVRKYKG